AGSFLTKTGFLQHWGFGEKDSEEFDKEKIIFSAKGACLLSPKSVIDKVGLFDDTFVSYFEETDYRWRVWLAGYKVLYSPVTSIEHKVGMTSKRMNQIDINYNSYKNRIRSLIKNLSFLNLIKIGSIHIVIS